ncbi:MAG: hypothetical protein EXQ67_00725 [Thermoleophilia bacterium]|nr:hypothetical protein [Thermoleophilia bacterium]
MRLALLALLLLLVVTTTCSAAPTITSPPTISGEAIVGDRLEAFDTLIDEATDADLTLTWERSMEGIGFVAIPAAHDPSYLVDGADSGRRLRVHVVVETAAGTDEAWSTPTALVAHASDAVAHGGPLKAGSVDGTPVRLAQWVVTAGTRVAITGQLPTDRLDAEAQVVLEATVAGHGPVATLLTANEHGHVSGVITPTVNAVAWLVLESGFEAPQRIRLGVVGVRPQIQLRLAASRDGVDAQGRALVRDLTLLAGSVVAPGVAGLRFSWEGILPGEQRGTAVCRSGERVQSVDAGLLRGGCSTRGAWSRARWRLVYDPGTSDLAASPFLRTNSHWVRPCLRKVDAAKVPDLPRAYATLRPWN